MSWKSTITTKLAPAIFASVLVVGAHYLLHSFLHDKITGLLNPLLISVLIGILYYMLRDPFGRNTDNSVKFALIVSVLHFAAHFVSSEFFLLDIISNTVVGIAGTTVLLSILILELFFDE